MADECSWVMTPMHMRVLLCLQVPTMLSSASICMHVRPAAFCCTASVHKTHTLTNTCMHTHTCTLSCTRVHPRPWLCTRDPAATPPRRAVRCLYTTFEQWYEEHPGGFSLGPTDFRNRQVATNEHEERLQRAGMARQKDQVCVCVCSRVCVHMQACA